MGASVWQNVYVMPPYVITDEDLDHLVTQMLEIIK